MATKKGYLKEKGTNNTIAPKTMSSCVEDGKRSRAMSKSLNFLAEYIALGYPVFSADGNFAVGEVVFNDRRLWKFKNAHTGAWNASDVEEFSMKEYIDAAVQLLVNGDVPAGLAMNLEPWADQDDLTVKDEWEDKIRTTGGSLMLVTEKGGQLMKIVAQTDFTASALRASGYNLLRLQSDNGIAKQITGGYIIPVPKLTFGEYGSAKENNGVVFTDINGDNLNPTVRFQPAASGEPTQVSDGTLLEAQVSKETANSQGGIYTDHDIKFYLTPGAGWLIVTGITYDETCAHIGWEDWYNKYVGPTDEDDGGDVVSIASIISAVHSDVNKLLAIGGGISLVSDWIEWASSQTATWHRLVGLATPTWTTTQDTVEEGAVQTYTHTATISGIKSGGQAALYGDNTPLVVVGTTVSIQTESATAPTGQVKYELDTQASGTVSVERNYALNDCGIEMLEGASGTAVVSTLYARNIADALYKIASYDMEAVEDSVEGLEHETAVATSETHDEASMDFESLPLLCGQPMKLYGNGTPQEAVVPDNWRQFADGGYNWNGTPSALGQEYINYASGGGKYEAVRDGAWGLKWQLI